MTGKMKRRIQAAWMIALLFGIAAMASASPTPIPELIDLNNGLKTIASALGVLVITYAGIKWIMSEGPQERDDAKKTIIYVVIALIVVALTKDLVHAIYCETTNNLAPPYGGGIC